LTKLLPKVWWLPFLEHSVVAAAAAAVEQQLKIDMVYLAAR